MIEPDPITFEQAVEILGEELEPDKDEARNGWTKETLTIYHAQAMLWKQGVVPSEIAPLPKAT